jgi:Uncharacterized protein conserved in bacteria (DUF2330)
MAQRSAVAIIAHMPRIRLAWACLLAIVAMVRANPAEACATAPPPNELVTIAGEEALIVWDADHSVEHFVRRAVFDTTASSFGFIVPTPTIPKLGEVPSEIFDTLDRVTAPPVIPQEDRHYEPSCILMRMGMKTEMAGVAVEPVRVLATQTVAGYDSVVLEADDPAALSTWLKDHGYADRPDLRDWLVPYVTNRWKLTAFKLSTVSKGLVSSAVVRMSFQTAQPFFPYREPPTTQKTPRTLRVYTFSSAGRMVGTLGKSAYWPGAVSYARVADATTLGVVGLSVPDYAARPGSGWLTRLDDESTPRLGIDEVYFSPSPSQAELLPSAKILPWPKRVFIPVDLIVLGIGALAVVSLVARRLHRRAPHS